jgi:hypothetical protein
LSVTSSKPSTPSWRPSRVCEMEMKCVSPFITLKKNGNWWSNDLARILVEEIHDDFGWF